jgi:hypothetical protein
MAFDYGTLTGPKSALGSIRSWINYDPLDVEGVLLDAQAYIYGAIRTREMIASAAVAITAGSETAPLPAGYLDPISFRIPSEMAVLSPRDPRDLEERRYYDANGVLDTQLPSAYSVFDELFQFDAKADADYVARAQFYKSPTALSRTNPSNFLCTRYPNLLRAAVLMHGADQMQDDAEYTRWKARTDELIGRVSVETDLMARGRDYDVSVR